MITAMSVTLKMRKLMFLSVSWKLMIENKILRYSLVVAINVATNITMQD